MEFFKNLITYRRNRIHRIIIKFSNGYSTGSGFFIGENKFLTCFHVAFTKELKNLRNDSQFISTTGTDEHSRLLAFYNNKVTEVQVELLNGVRVNASLKEFNEKYDVALFEVSLNGEKIKTCVLDWKPKLDIGDYVFFGGFPIHHGYAPDHTPFAVHEGMVSSWIETIVGGEKYKHLQIHSINLGGNSGAPLFKKGRKKVIGIVNGNMNWGNDYVMMKNANNNQTSLQSFRVPLSIAYATSLDILKENTDLF